MRGMTIGWLVGSILGLAFILFLSYLGVLDAIGSGWSFIVGMGTALVFVMGGLVIGGLLDDSY